MKKNKILLLILAFTLAVLATPSCKKETEGKMRTELLPVEGSPLISFRILLDIGSANDPAGKEGVANLTAELAMLVG